MCYRRHQTYSLMAWYGRWSDARRRRVTTYETIDGNVVDADRATPSSPTRWTDALQSTTTFKKAKELTSTSMSGRFPQMAGLVDWTFTRNEKKL